MGTLGFRRYRPAIAALLCAVIFLWGLPQYASADDAAALLQKHRDYMGWQFGDGTVKSLVLERQLTDKDGKVTQTAREDRIALVYRRDYSGGKTFGSTGFTGKVFWSTGRNGFTTPYVGRTSSQLLSVDALFMEGTPELPAEIRPSQTIDGKSVAVVRVTMQGAQPIDLYVDPDTGAYKRAVIDPGESDETTINIHSYTTIAPGKHLIGSWSYDDATSTYAYTKVTLNPVVQDDDLTPPAPTATWSFKNDQPFPIRVTDDRIYLDAIVNGTRGRFILDTGDDGITLTDDFANHAQVKTIESGKAWGIGGIAKMLVRRADTIELGGNSLSNVIVDTVNQTFSEENNNEKVDGFIGYDVFAATQVTLSLSNHTMQIVPGGNAVTPPAGSFPVTVDLSDDVPIVPVKLEDRFGINAMLDTGDPAAVVYSHDARNHGILMTSTHGMGFLNANAAVGGIGGDEYMYCGTLQRITMGPIVYSGMDACESHNVSLHGGIVGFDFLKHFDYIFDYPHSEIVLIPHKD
jgi:predicted aspartyl protease